MNRMRLGDMLMAHRLITHDQLERALQMQEERGEPLGTVLIESGLITEELLVMALAAQKGVPAWDLEQEPPSLEALTKVPGSLCTRYQLLPVQVRGDLLLVAMREPTDLDVIDHLRTATHMRIEPVYASEDRLVRCIEQMHGRATSTGNSMDALVNRAMNEMRSDGSIGKGHAHEELSEEDMRPVVVLVNQVISDAIRMRASDIHIEPRFQQVDIRFRIDGELTKVREIPSELMPMVITRIKIMAQLDIVEFRIPQDGRITVNIDNRTVDLRVSVLPNYHGQRIVLRVLDKSIALKKLDEMGFSSHNLCLFRTLIQKPYGLILVTGPTGSGKTTTLYGALSELKRISNNIMTCEDPVEYDIEGINQSQVHEKVGLTFASQLRAILRQDPDIVLVGEIRDQETAQTAIRAALTGHLVLSTLHCNDAPSAVPRLLDMGIDPYLLSTSLIGVMAQRLLRKVCPHCKTKVEPTEQELAVIHGYLGSVTVPHLAKSRGCDRCGGTGFAGRIGVHEILPVAGDVSKKIATCAPVDTVREVGTRYGYRTIQQDALDRVVECSTTFHEADRFIYFDSFAATEDYGLRVA
ncbi:MAG: GspE/PulE family protein [Fimbriimonadaceae bacterium]|nr:GspE/PulE family protein [Fimbriimonadaceae bacterium]